MENIVEKRRNCSWGAISPLFHNIFNISLTSKVQLPISLLNVVNQIIFSSILQTWYVELLISRSISESPLEFEITRVDCIYKCLQKAINTNELQWLEHLWVMEICSRHVWLEPLWVNHSAKSGGKRGYFRDVFFNLLYKNVMLSVILTIAVRRF